MMFNIMLTFDFAVVLRNSKLKDERSTEHEHDFKILEGRGKVKGISFFSRH